jgi:hypothetical protein
MASINERPLQATPAVNIPENVEPLDGDTKQTDLTFEKCEDGIQKMESIAERPYTIYTKKQKILIILAASIASFFSPMSANVIHERPLSAVK